MPAPAAQPRVRARSFRKLIAPHARTAPRFRKRKVRRFTHPLARAERSGPTVAPCQTFPTPARGVHRLPPSQQRGILSGLATCNAARSSTGTGFAGIANLPAHPLQRACCLQSIGPTPVRPTSRPRPLLPSTLVVAAFLWRPKTSENERASPQASPFPVSENQPVIRGRALLSSARPACGRLRVNALGLVDISV